jgi:hypothetical protein
MNIQRGKSPFKSNHKPKQKAIIASIYENPNNKRHLHKQQPNNEKGNGVKFTTQGGS